MDRSSCAPGVLRWGAWFGFVLVHVDDVDRQIEMDLALIRVESVSKTPTLSARRE